jgi:hypothetical protein
MAISKEEKLEICPNPSQFHNFFPRNVTIFLEIFFQKVTLTMLLGTFSSFFFFGSKMSNFSPQEINAMGFHLSTLWKVLEYTIMTIKYTSLSSFLEHSNRGV